MSTTQPTTTAAAARKPWSRRTKLIVAGAAAIVVLVGATGAVIGINTAQRNAIVQASADAQEQLRTAIGADTAARNELNTAIITGLDGSQASTAALVALGALVDAKAAEAAAAEISALDVAIADAADATGTDLDAEGGPVVASSANERIARDASPAEQQSDEELKASAAQALAAAAREESSADEMTALAGEIHDAQAGVDVALVTLAVEAPAAKDAHLAAYPSAGQAEKDALNAALVKLQELASADEPVLEALAAYAAAGKAVSDSHVAVEAQKAAEAALQAAQAADSPTYTDPSTGEVRQNPSYGGGGGDQGSPGGSTGGGGPSNPGTPGGGQTDQNRYVSTNGAYVSMGSCEWASPIGTHDPGPGGTSSPGYGFPWSYSNEGTYIQFYSC